MTQSILYLARLHSDHVNALLKEALILSKSLDSQGTLFMVYICQKYNSDQNFAISSFFISRLWSLILILVKPLLISELLYDK
jgi:hypothetical protein